MTFLSNDVIFLFACFDFRILAYEEMADRLQGKSTFLRDS
jgi:hypothetical protein